MTVPAHQSTRRVQLPSGRYIDVIYFTPLEAEAAGAAAAAAASSPVEELDVCPECDQDLVYPVDWEEVSVTHWQVELRCPNCEWTHVGTYDQATVDRFDERLDMHTETVEKEARRVSRENMLAEAEAFSAALEAGAILPEDF